MSSGSIIAVAAPHGLRCRQSAVSPRANGLTNARWQLVHGDPNPWRPKTIAQRCGALIAASASAGSAFFKPFEDPEFLETTGLIRFGLKRDTPGKWLRSSQRPGHCHILRLVPSCD